MGEGDAKKIGLNKKALEQIIDMVQAVRPDEIDEDIKASLQKLHTLIRGVQVESVKGRKYAPLVNAEPGKEQPEKPEPTKEESKKEEPKKGEAKEASKAIDPKEAAKALRAQKNQFAINRLIFMLLDLDPANLTQKMIDDLKQMHELLVKILSHQSGPKEESGKDGGK